MLTQAKRRRLTAILAILVFALVGLTLGVDLFAAARGPFELASLYHKWRYQQDEPAIGIHVPDEQLGFVVKANVVTETTVAGRNISIVTDSDGARIDPDKPPVDARNVGRAPLVVVGGSQSFGHGVFQRETFSSIIGEGLGRPDRNFSISSSSTVTALLMVQRHVTRPGTIVVYGFWSDHLNRNLRPCANGTKPYCIGPPFVDWTGNGRPEIRLAFDPYEMFRLDRRLQLADKEARAADQWAPYIEARERIMARHFSDPYSDLMAARKTDTAAMLLQKLDTVLKERDSTLLVVYLANYLDQSQMTPMPEDLRRRLEASGIPFLDMYATFRATLDAGSRLALLGDGHMNPEAHRLVGEAVLRYLKESGIE